MSLLGLLSGNPGGLSTASNQASNPLLTQDSAVQSNNPAILRQYLSNLGGGQANAGTLAQQLSKNNSGVSYQEIASALGVGGGGSGDTTASLPTGGTAGAGGSSTADPAYWQQQLGLLDSQIARLPGQQSVGEQNILDQYKSALDTLTNQEGQATRDYTTAKNQTSQDNISAKAGINDSVRNQLTGVQRLLGSLGSGNSSAAQVLAPYAAGVLGNQQRSAVSTNYANNVNALDTNYGDTTNQFNSAVGNLGAQKTNNERQLQSGIDNTRQQALQQRATYLANLGLPADPNVANQINQLGDQITGLGASATFDPGKVDYTAPNLASYAVAPTSAPAVNGPNPNLTQNLGAFYTLLNPQQKDKTGNTILQPSAA